MNYKIIFIDIDGTLKDSRKNISQETIDTIKKVRALGIEVVLVSGKDLKSAVETSIKVGASEYVIAYNGGEIYNYKKREILLFNEIEHLDVLKLYRKIEKEDCLLVLNSNLLRYSNLIQENYIYYKANDLENIRVSQMVISSVNEELINYLKKDIEQIPNVSSDLPRRYNSLDEKQIYTLYVTSISSTKGKAVLELCKYFKIKPEQAIVIGDSDTDLSMFELPTYKVAVSNAISQLKENSNCITMSNDHEGVKIFLEKLIENINKEENML